jgi:hypothetical protein
MRTTRAAENEILVQVYKEECKRLKSILEYTMKKGGDI